MIKTKNRREVLLSSCRKVCWMNCYGVIAPTDHDEWCSLPFVADLERVLNRLARASSDIFCNAVCTLKMTSFSWLSSCGVFFPARIAAAISLLSSLEIAMMVF